MDHSDKKNLLKIISIADAGKTFLTTRQSLAMETKLPLYFVDRALYLLMALGILHPYTAGRTQVFSVTAFTEEVLGLEPYQPAPLKVD